MALFHTTVLDNQIKALPTVDTASGSIASFNTDLTENLVEVKCQIVAKQASGTPSPVNPLPITTYTEMNVSHSGINLCDEVFEGGGIATGSGQNDDTMTQYIRTKNYLPVLPNMSLYFYVSANTSIQFRIFYYDRDKNYLSYVNWTTTRTQTVPSNAYFVRLLPYMQYGTTYNNDISINYPSSNTTYHAYNGTTANIPFNQTVANGVLDIGSGKLRVTHQVVSTTWGNFVNKTVLTNYTRGQLNITSFGIGINTNPSDICNVAPFKANYSSDDCHFYVAVSGSFTNLNLFLPNDTPNDTAIQLVYELATPIDIQLDSITLQALLNENNIWCDTGDTEVKFLLTVGKKIS